MTRPGWSSWPRPPRPPATGLVALALAVFSAGLGLGLPLAGRAVLLRHAGAHQTGMGNTVSRTLQEAFGVALGAAILGSVLDSAYRGALAGHLAWLPPAAARRRGGQRGRRPRRRRAPARYARAAAGSCGQLRLRPGHDPRGGCRHRVLLAGAILGLLLLPGGPAAGRPEPSASRSCPPPSARPRQSRKRGVLQAWALRRRRQECRAGPQFPGLSPSSSAKRTCS